MSYYSSEEFVLNLTDSSVLSADEVDGNATSMEIMLWPSVAVGILLSVIVLLTVGGNLLILAAVLFNSNLRGPTHILIANLAVADLLLGFLVLPFSATLEVTNRWYFGSIFCDVWAAVDVLCCTASIMSLCVISVDRYIGVTRPLNYYSIVTAQRATVLCLFVWISSLSISIGPLLGWKERPPHHQQEDQMNISEYSNITVQIIDAYECSVTTETGYVLFSAIGSFYLPTLVILAVYWRIYRAAVQQTKFLESGTKTEKSSLSTEVTLRVHVGRASPSARTTNHLQLVKGQQQQQQRPLNKPSQHNNKRHSTSNNPGDVDPTTTTTDPATAGSSSGGGGGSTAPVATTVTGLSAKLFKFRRQKKAAKTLGIVVGAFLLCWFPFFVILPVEALCSTCKIPKPLFSFCFWLGYCNSCLNPFIYASTSREFKRAFSKILCGRKRTTTTATTAAASHHHLRPIGVRRQSSPSATSNNRSGM